MRSIALLLVVVLAGWSGLTDIRTRNLAVQAATRAYRHQQYREAVQQFQRALATSHIPEENIVLNLGHAAWQAGQLAVAQNAYSKLLASPNPAIRSVAQQQLGVLRTRRGDYAQAARFLRQALLTNPRNTAARYNYEAVMRYLTRRPVPTIPPPDQPNAPGEQPNQTSPQPKDQAGTQRSGQLDDPAQQDTRQPPQRQPNAQGKLSPRQNGSKGQGNAQGFQPGQGTEQQVAQGKQPGTVRGLGDPTTDQPRNAPAGLGRSAGAENAAANATDLQTQRARLQQMQLSTAQAQQLLDALRASEQQYIQQLPRKNATPAPSAKPAW